MMDDQFGPGSFTMKSSMPFPVYLLYFSFFFIKPCRPKEHALKIKNEHYINKHQHQ